MASRLLSLALVVALAAALPHTARAQAVADTSRGGLGVRLAFPDGIVGLRVPGAALVPPRGALGADAVLERFRSGLDAALERARLRRQRDRLLARLYRGDSLAIALGLDEAAQPRPDRGLLGLATSNVELNFDGQLELEISTDRFKNLRCTAFQLQDPLSGCQPKFTAPRIDNQLDLLLGGMLVRR